MSLVLSGAASAGDMTHRLDLGAADIESVVFEESTAWLKLTPGAAASLHEITGANQGDWLQISVDGIDAMIVRIFSPVDSGVVQVSRPSDELRARLTDFE